MKGRTVIFSQPYLRVQKQMTVCRFSVSACSPNLLYVALKALENTSREEPFSVSRPQNDDEKLLCSVLSEEGWW